MADLAKPSWCISHDLLGDAIAVPSFRDAVSGFLAPNRSAGTGHRAILMTRLGPMPRPSRLLRSERAAAATIGCQQVTWAWVVVAVKPDPFQLCRKPIHHDSAGAQDVWCQTPPSRQGGTAPVASPRVRQIIYIEMIVTVD